VIDLLKGRQRPGFGWTEILALGGFCAVVGTGVRVHEGWADEAQSWLLARDMSWLQLLFHGVRYEGSPGLWHILLWILNRLQFSFYGMHWIAAGLATGGAFILLRWSPFPLLLRILFPFTFFLAYQNAVIARSYVLFPLLVFSVAALLSAQSLRPIPLALTTGLLANISLHGFVEATGLAIAVFAAWKIHLKFRCSIQSKWNIAFAVGIFTALWLIAIATAAPPADISARPGVRIVRALHGKAFDNNLSRGIEQFDNKNSVSNDELSLVLLPGQKKTKWEAKQLMLIKQLSVITYALSESHLLGLLLFTLLLSRGIGSSSQSERGIARWQPWIGLFPYFLMVLFFSRMYLRPWHTGTLFASFVAALWLTWPKEKSNNRFVLWRERAFVLALLLMCFEQISWTAHALTQDIHGAYCGDQEAANFLTQNAQGRTIAGFYFFSVGPEAYLGRAIYMNQPGREYWSWSNKDHVDARAPEVLREHPDYVLISVSSDWDQQSILHGWHLLSGKPVSETTSDDLGDDYRIADYFQQHGYHKTHVFLGHAGMRSGSFATLCQVILEPDR
jgi:hypothetical protein